jgi:hypothetical protein
MSAQTRSYASRAEKANPILKQLFTLMEEKKTNLCVSVDYTDPEKILDIIDSVPSFPTSSPSLHPPTEATNTP